MRNNPQKMIGCVLLLAMLTAAGCSVNQSLIEASDSYHRSVASDYMRYVADDGELEQVEKDLRMDAYLDFGKSIEKAKRLDKPFWEVWFGGEQ